MSARLAHEIRNPLGTVLINLSLLWKQIITDLSMPVMDGLKVLRVIKNGFPNLPVIVLTAFGDAETEARALGTGAHAFLYKPVDEPRLLALVGNAAGAGNG